MTNEPTPADGEMALREQRTDQELCLSGWHYVRSRYNDKCFCGVSHITLDPNL